MKTKTILISGGGVAGLTLAYWLKRFGFIPTLVEKHPYLRTGGYKIDLRGAGLEVMKRMGVYPFISESRTRNKRGILLDEEGRQLMEMGVDLLGTRLEDFDLEIMRTRLCHILKDAVGEVECLFGDSIRTISDREDGAYVEFEVHSPRTFDLVIGADGLHSKVRKIAFGEESQFLKDLGVYVSVWNFPNFLNLNECEIEQHTLRKFVNLYRDHKESKATVAIAFSSPQLCDSRDPKDQKEFVSRAFSNVKWSAFSKILEGMYTGSDSGIGRCQGGALVLGQAKPALKQLNLKSLAMQTDPKTSGCPTPAEPIFESQAVYESPYFYFDCMAQIHMPHWSKGRVALVGDAAYSATPLSGQGTSIAIAGAYVLAGELFEADGDFMVAFSRYEELMRPFIKKNQALADMSMRIMQDSAYSRWLHRIGALMPSKLVDYFKKRALKQTTKAANALRLKDYEKNR
jgi:2-polyprenyl-6-methoxyphenol hydroxylase-like FAD-dependent oxidoreductase